MNKVVLVGNITQDIELRTTASGISTRSFGLAVGRSRKNKDGSRTTDFITIVAWRHTAEYCAKYLCKGDRIAVAGSWQNRSFEDKQGIKRTVSECVAEEVQPLKTAPHNHQGFEDAGDYTGTPFMD